MTHTYNVAGMTCSGCEASVKTRLLTLPDVTEVVASRDSNTARIGMNRHTPLSALQQTLGAKYHITADKQDEVTEAAKSWLVTYKPILLLFGYITVVALIVATREGYFNWQQAMTVFMSAFYLAFSFFKLLDLKAFAESYAMYDVVARRLPVWGFVYPFMELLLGIAYATGFLPLVTNGVALVLMLVSIVGVLQSVMSSLCLNIPYRKYRTL